MVNYPDEFPSKALGILLEKVRGKAVETPTLALAGWNVLGYALGKSLGGGPAPVGDQGGLSDEEVLEAALNSQEEEGAKGGAIPWAIVAQVVLKILINSLI
jgi:hypothetical protein